MNIIRHAPNAVQNAKRENRLEFVVAVMIYMSIDVLHADMSFGTDFTKSKYHICDNEPRMELF